MPNQHVTFFKKSSTSINTLLSLARQSIIENPNQLKKLVLPQENDMFNTSYERLATFFVTALLAKQLIKNFQKSTNTVENQAAVDSLEATYSTCWFTVKELAKRRLAKHRAFFQQINTLIDYAEEDSLSQLRKALIGDLCNAFHIVEKQANVFLKAMLTKPERVKNLEVLTTDFRYNLARLRNSKKIVDLPTLLQLSCSIEKSLYSMSDDSQLLEEHVIANLIVSNFFKKSMPAHISQTKASF